jgi:hypothetical protein
MNDNLNKKIICNYQVRKEIAKFTKNILKQKHQIVRLKVLENRN